MKEVKLVGVKRHAGKSKREGKSAGEDGEVEGLERRGRSAHKWQLLPSSVSET